MTLSAADQDRVAETVRQMVAEYRAKPTPEKEDGLGVELARMPAEERDYVTTVLLRMLAEERRPPEGVEGA